MIQNYDKHRQPESEAPKSGRKIEPVQALRKHWKVGLAAFFLVLFLGVPYAWIKGKKSFRSEGVLYISPRNWRNLDADQEQDLQSNSQFREFMQQQAFTVNRYDIVLPIVTGSGPGATHFRNPGESERRAADRLRGSLQIAVVPDTYQMTVGLEGDRPEGLAEIVNAVMDNFVQVSRREMFYDSDSRLKNLAEEHDRVQKDIDSIMERRNAIAERIGTTLFNGGVINNYEKLASANMDALMDARRQRLSAESALGGPETKPSIEAGLQATATEESLRDGALVAYRSALGARRADLLAKIQGLSPKHAGRIAAEKDIAAIDAEMQRATDEAKKISANDLRNVQLGKLAQTSDLEKKFSHEAAEINAKASDYMHNYQLAMNLGEELDRLRKRLSATEDRMSQLQLESKAPGYVRIFSTAMTPEFPVKGGRKRLLGFVGLAALMLGLMVPIGIDYLDPRVRSAAELEAVLGLPVTGWLPKVDASPAHSDEILRLAVVIRRHLPELSQQALVVSALKHGSGSTSISLGLGRALSTLGVRTLVVEANPKTPDDRYLGSYRPGVASWAAGTVPLRECVNPATSGLPDRIPTGDQASELGLMAGDTIPRLVAEARETYDCILIDGAPVGCSLLGEELIRQLDAVLLVSQAGIDNKREIKATLKKIERLRPRTFGSVLNTIGDRKEVHDSTALLVA